MNYFSMMISGAFGAVSCALMQRWLHADPAFTMAFYVGFLLGVFTRQWIKLAK